MGKDVSDPQPVYDRLARVYDLYSGPMEWMGGPRRRRRLFDRAVGAVLEAGVGTGMNLDYYPESVHVTAIDISSGMLERAGTRAESAAAEVDLAVADVEQLPYPDDTFDTATAACVFCSVADPVQGLRELARVTRPDGQVLLLEHVRPRNHVLGLLADLVSPLSRWLFGPYVNRRTERNVAAAGLETVDVRRDGVWREIQARPVRGGS